VFGYADDIEAVSVEVPAMVVQAVLEDEATPRDVVTDLLQDALSVAAGRVPDPAGLPELVDSAREQVLRLRPGDRDDALAGLLERLTPLDPRRPCRDLLEHLLDGINSCLLLYREESAEERPLSEDDEEDSVGEIAGPVVEEFCAAVRERAAPAHRRVEEA
jgi:hypothetical protein